MCLFPNRKKVWDANKSYVYLIRISKRLKNNRLIHGIIFLYAFLAHAYWKKTNSKS